MRVRYRLAALADLSHIYSHINKDDQNAARTVVRRIRTTVNRLELFPRSGREGVKPGTFELVVPGLPYIVEPEIVDIVAVFHAAQDR